MVAVLNHHYLFLSKSVDDQLIDSTSFQEQANYRNPQSKPLENEEQVANPVSVGAYIILIVA
jgi:hypothetical protein